jgi:hypothetical protein
MIVASRVHVAMRRRKRLIPRRSGTLGGVSGHAATSMGPVAARVVALAIVTLAAACTPKLYDPALATKPYPRELHDPSNVATMQVFRDGTKIEIVNATPSGFSDFDLWLNQRYVRHVDALPAGGRLTLSLWDFRDERGDVINAGGLWRIDEAMPVRLVQIHDAPNNRLVGLITIRAEPPEQRRTLN